MRIEPSIIIFEIRSEKELSDEENLKLIDFGREILYFDSPLPLTIDLTKVFIRLIDLDNFAFMTKKISKRKIKYKQMNGLVNTVERDKLFYGIKASFFEKIKSRDVNEVEKKFENLKCKLYLTLEFTNRLPISEIEFGLDILKSARTLKGLKIIDDQRLFKLNDFSSIKCNVKALSMAGGLDKKFRSVPKNIDIFDYLQVFTIS